MENPSTSWYQQIIRCSFYKLYEHGVDRPVTLNILKALIMFSIPPAFFDSPTKLGNRAGVIFLKKKSIWEYEKSKIFLILNSI